MDRRNFSIEQELTGFDNSLQAERLQKKTKHVWDLKNSEFLYSELANPFPWSQELTANAFVAPMHANKTVSQISSPASSNYGSGLSSDFNDRSNFQVDTGENAPFKSS